MPRTRATRPLTPEEHRHEKRVQISGMLIACGIAFTIIFLEMPTWLRVIAMLLLAVLLTPVGLFETYGEYLDWYERHKPLEK